MGTAPMLAMDLLCYPPCLPLETVREILAGGSDKVSEVGTVIAGGHTIEDSEPQYGLCVSGLAHPGRILKNSGAQIGDLLLLTKPLGSGILVTAAKAELAQTDAFKRAVENMTTLNRAAEEVLSHYRVHTCTDVTGFGLLDHAFEMAGSSQKIIRLFSGKLPLLPTAVSLAEMGIIPAGTYRNVSYLEQKAAFGPGVVRSMRDILCDPQTADGLLATVPAGDAPPF